MALKVDRKLDREGRIHQSYCSRQNSPSLSQFSLFWSTTNSHCWKMWFWGFRFLISLIFGRKGPGTGFLCRFPLQQCQQPIWNYCISSTTTLCLGFYKDVVRFIADNGCTLVANDCLLRFVIIGCLRFCRKCLFEASQIGFWGRIDRSYCSHSHRRRKAICWRHLSKSKFIQSCRDKSPDFHHWSSSSSTSSPSSSPSSSWWLGGGIASDGCPEMGDVPTIAKEMVRIVIVGIFNIYLYKLWNKKINDITEENFGYWTIWKVSILLFFKKHIDYAKKSIIYYIWHSLRCCRI